MSSSFAIVFPLKIGVTSWRKTTAPRRCCSMPVPAGDWIGIKGEWAAIWRTVDGGGFDPGLQPDADLRVERKKSPHAASFVSMVCQCLYRCSSRCYLQGAEP
jgi:hypothetical protein